MDDIKQAIIAGGCGFGISFLVALGSGVRLPMLLVRPLIFGIIFFALGAGAMYLYRRFLAGETGKQNKTGQNVDISLDDNDSKMILGDDTEFTGFAGPGLSFKTDEGDEQGEESGFHQNREGLEQNSTIGYTENEYNASSSFKPMSFDVVNKNTDNEGSRFVASPLAGEQKAYARVPELDKMAKTDPKKLASTVQNLLSDE
jgi:hypothetical protein